MYFRYIFTEKVGSGKKIPIILHTHSFFSFHANVTFPGKKKRQMCSKSRVANNFLDLLRNWKLIPTLVPFKSCSVITYVPRVISSALYLMEHYWNLICMAWSIYIGVVSILSAEGWQRAEPHGVHFTVLIFSKVLAFKCFGHLKLSLVLIIEVLSIFGYTNDCLLTSK